MLRGREWARRRMQRKVRVTTDTEWERVVVHVCPVRSRFEVRRVIRLIERELSNIRSTKFCHERILSGCGIPFLHILGVTRSIDQLHAGIIDLTISGIHVKLRRIVFRIHSPGNARRGDRNFSNLRPRTETAAFGTFVDITNHT